MTTGKGNELAELVDAARSHDKWAVSRLITTVEDTRPGAADRRRAVFEALASDSTGTRDRGRGRVLGITGTPGSGKSTLLSRVTTDLLDADEGLSLAVVAVDPSSEVSGGSLLGDRTRMRLPAEGRAFFRSQASANALGGLGPSTYQVVNLLSLLFDLVFVETVGIGQSEADIRHLADRVYLVLQPLGGDEVQFLKAGIIEHPDVFVLNKSDQAGAESSYHQLTNTLWLARPFDEEAPTVLRVSALTGEGTDALVHDLAAAGSARETSQIEASGAYFFRRWMTEEWGRNGLRWVDEHLGGAEALLAECGGYDQAIAEVVRRTLDAIPFNS